MAKVMLVEDDITMLSLMRTLLQFEGFEVVHQDPDASLEEALDTLRMEQPDLALVDINLRRFNGFDLLKRAHQDPVLKPTKILMSSGMDLGMRCIAEGADGFVMKPYMPDELIGKIRQLLG